MKEKTPLITISDSSVRKGFKMVRISYLAGVTPRRFAKVVQRIMYERADLKKYPLVIVSDDGQPCFWACSILASFCPLIPMIAIDTRERRKNSCLVIRDYYTGKDLVGKYIPNPDGNSGSHRKTSVAKKF